jgi:hypothetical protein
MRMVARSNKQVALLFAIFLAVFSTGVVIAHQCQAMLSNQVATQHQYSDTNSMSTIATKPVNVATNKERLIDSGCAALFIAVLLLGRKLFILTASRPGLKSFVIMSRELVSIDRPQVFHLALSRSQLGIIRI